MKQINLLPKPRQQELRYESIFYSFLVVFSLTILSFILVFLAQFTTKFYLQAKSENVNNQIAVLQSQVNKQENADLKKKIQNINNIILDFNSLADAYPKWSGIIKAFAPLPPQGVSIANFNIEPTKKIITITGYAPTRELVIQLYNNILQDTDDFFNIDYPLENVAKPTEINFHFTFNIQNRLLK